MFGTNGYPNLSLEGITTLTGSLANKRAIKLHVGTEYCIVLDNQGGYHSIGVNAVGVSVFKHK
jgi:hypothetical protein